MAFFYPIHYVGFIHLQDFPYSSATYAAVVHFDCQFSGFFRVFMPFRVYGIIFAALLTLAALAPRGVIPCLDLVFYLSAFRASFPCLFCSFSHISYYIIKSLFWTLPSKKIHRKGELPVREVHGSFTPPHSTTVKPFRSKGLISGASISIGSSSGVQAMKTRKRLSGSGVIESFAPSV